MKEFYMRQRDILANHKEVLLDELIKIHAEEDVKDDTIRFVTHMLMEGVEYTDCKIQSLNRRIKKMDSEE